jgi:hypothetical protein
MALEIVIAAPPDRDKVFAEIWVSHELLLELNNEQNSPELDLSSQRRPAVAHLVGRPGSRSARSDFRTDALPIQSWQCDVDMSVSLVRAAIRAGFMIGVIRCAMFCAGYCLTRTSDVYLQLIGILILLLDCSPELKISGRIWTGSRDGGIFFVSGLILMTSGLLGYGWALMRRRDAP